MNPYTTIINRVLALITAIAITVLVMNQVTAYIRSTGVDACSRVSRIERMNEDTKAKEIFAHPELYEKCLVDKGLK